MNFGTGLTTPLVRFQHFDRLGSVVATSHGQIALVGGVRNWKGIGALQNTYRYDPYGESVALTGTGHDYAGYRCDAETGLYHSQARCGSSVVPRPELRARGV